jgi:hypothetical protein
VVNIQLKKKPEGTALNTTVIENSFSPTTMALA